MRERERERERETQRERDRQTDRHTDRERQINIIKQTYNTDNVKCFFFVKKMPPGQRCPVLKNT
jgi:hypothetical protein